MGSRLSFAEAASELGYLKGVRVAAATARRRTEADGALYAALQDAAAVHLLVDPPPPRRGPATQQVSVDGAMVPLVDGSWREVRTLAIGTVVPGRQPGTVRCEDLSYFSRLCDAERFLTVAAGEIHRRGVETAGRVALVVDGADWEQTFGDVHCPAAVRILDFPHGAQRLSDLAEAVWEAQETGRVWAAAQRGELRDGTPEAVLAAIRALPLTAARDTAAAGRVQAEVVGYLEPRLEQLRYAAFRAQGLPIGSGIVESANKLVVEARLKGAGRRWAEAHVTPMVALRGALCSERWEEAWTAIATARRVHCSPPAVPMVAPLTSAASVAAPRRRPHPPASPAVPRSGPKTIVHGRPTARHPWKRFPIVPSSPAKL
ncbi:MAG: hypothetical protein K0S78_6031 [Thermomicrobiales bacterium]|nr:hypothetical protein [Thermomicrobiales bacterium]